MRALAAEIAHEEGGHVALLIAWIRDAAHRSAATPEDLDPPNVLG